MHAASPTAALAVLLAGLALFAPPTAQAYLVEGPTCIYVMDDPYGVRIAREECWQYPPGQECVEVSTERQYLHYACMLA